MSRVIHIHQSLVAPLVISLALAVFPWGKYALYPFKIFTTWLHECCHALAAIIAGGHVTRIELNRDGSGVTYYRLPPGRLRQAWVSSVGYPGACAGGCALYWLYFSARAYVSQLELFLAGAMLLSGIIWVRGAFGLTSLIVMSTGLFVLATRSSTHGTTPNYPYFADTFFAFLAIQTALSALTDIRELFNLSPGSKSDAHALQSALLIPAWLWSTLCLVLCLAMCFATVTLT